MLAAISARENPCDAFVSNNYAALDDLPVGAIVGTSSRAVNLFCAPNTRNW